MPKWKKERKQQKLFYLSLLQRNRGTRRKEPKLFKNHTHLRAAAHVLTSAKQIRVQKAHKPSLKQHECFMHRTQSDSCTHHVSSFNTGQRQSLGLGFLSARD